MNNYSIISITPYPCYKIELKDLNNPIDVSAICAKLGVEDYVYEVKFEDCILKYGLSFGTSKSMSWTPGERIYRQCGHLPGWNKPLLGPSGSDMLEITRMYFKKSGKLVDRNGVTVTIHDLTNVKSPSIVEPYLHVKQLESKLINDYKNKYGQTPIGNIKDESYVGRIRYTPDEVFNSLFEFDGNS